jgi:hypothetical protein
VKKEMIKINTGYDLDLYEIFNEKNLDQACLMLRNFAEDVVKKFEPTHGKSETIVFDTYAFDEITVSISYLRLETDAEYEYRINIEENKRKKIQEREQKKLEKEKRLYEELKQKFEKG